METTILYYMILYYILLYSIISQVLVSPAKLAKVAREEREVPQSYKLLWVWVGSAAGCVFARRQLKIQLA